VDVSAPDLEIHAIDRDKSAELLDETLRLQNAIVCHQALFVGKSAPVGDT
jgi:hypothetical protein